MSARLVLRQIAVGVAVRGWTQVTSLVVMLFAGRVLERQEFGVYTIASVFIVLLSTMTYSGFYEYIIKSADLDEVADTCFWLNLGFTVAGALLIAAMSPGIAALSHAPEVANLMLWLAPSAIVSALNSWQEALWLRANRLTSNYLAWCISETLAAAFSVVLLLAGARLLSLVGYRYGQVTLMLLYYLVRSPRLPCFRWRTGVAISALSFASNLYVSRFVGILSNYSADLIIGMLVGPAASGLYRLASRVVFGISEVYYQPIRTIAWVRFTRAVRAGGRIEEDWLGLMQLLSLVVWPTLGGAAVLATPLTVTLLGHKWADAAPIVVVLAGARCAGLFEIFLDPMLASLNRPYRLLQIRAGGAVVATGSLLVLGRFGVLPAAWVQAGTLLCLGAITIAIGLRTTSLSVRALWVALAPGVIITVFTMGAAVLGAQQAAHWLPIPSVRLGGGFVVGAFAWAFLTGAVLRRFTVRALRRFREPNTGFATGEKGPLANTG